MRIVVVPSCVEMRSEHSSATEIMMVIQKRKKKRIVMCKNYVYVCEETEIESSLAQRSGALPYRIAAFFSQQKENNAHDNSAT